MAYTNPWSNLVPPGTEPANTIDEHFRRLRLDVSERMNDVVVDWTADPVVLDITPVTNLTVANLKVIGPPAPGVVTSPVAMTASPQLGNAFTHTLNLAAGAMPDPDTHILIAFAYRIYKTPAPPFAVNWTYKSWIERWWDNAGGTNILSRQGAVVPTGNAGQIVIGVDLIPNAIKVYGYIWNETGAAIDVNTDYKVVLLQIAP